MTCYCLLLQSGAATPCTCDECQKDVKRADENNQANKKEAITPNNTTQSQNNTQTTPNKADNGSDRTVDVLVHDAPNMPRFFQCMTSQAFPAPGAPPPGFVVAPYQPPRFHNGGNVEDLLGDVQSTATIQTTYIQQNSIFMCNTRNIVQNKCCCQSRDSNAKTEVCQEQTPKCYVTEKNIELTYDYPRTRPIPSNPSQKSEEVQSTTTEVASTVVFVEKKMPVKPKKFDFFFRSRSAPVGENEEPIYATVNKLPKKLRRMELANLEKEVAYKNGEIDSSTRTEITLKTDTDSQAPPPDDDTSRSEREKSTVLRQESPKAKKRKRFSLTFKKRERKRREKKDKNGVKNGVPVLVESDNERLLEEQEARHRHCPRHRAAASPRAKRDSYQVHPNDTMRANILYQIHLTVIVRNNNFMLNSIFK